MTPLLLTLMLSMVLERPAASEQAKPLPDRTSFLIEFQVKRPGLLKAVGAATNYNLLSQYTYTEKVTEITLDSSGKPKKTETNKFEIIPTSLWGITYQRQIEKNGVPLTQKELDKQDNKHKEDFEKALAERSKRQEESRQRTETARLKFEQTLAKELDKQGITGEERRRREAEARKVYQEGISGVNRPKAPPPRIEDSEILMACDFQLVRREVIDGHSVILLTFKPNPKYKPKGDVARMFQHAAGRVWVSEEDYEPVKLEAEVTDPISFGFGILGKIQPGSKGAMEWRKINNEIWLPVKDDFTGKARILLVKGMHMREIHEYSEHKKYVVDTQFRFEDTPSNP